MSRLRFAIVLPFGAVFALHCYVRGIDAVLGPTLETELAISAADLGYVTSLYLLTYALMQLPGGIVLDRWGYARTLAPLLLVASAGTLLFGLGREPFGLGLGRACLGLGMSVSLSAAIKALADHVGDEQLPAWNGLVIALGGIGALLATAPSATLFAITGWRPVFIGIALALALLAVPVWRAGRLTPARPALSGAATDALAKAGLWDVLASAYFWRATALISVSYGGFAAVQGLWLAPWLTRVSGIAAGRVDLVLLVVAASMTVGTLSFGLVRELGRLTGLGLPAMVAIGTLLHMATQGLVIAQHFTESLGFWAVFGFLAPITMLVYAMLAAHFGPALSGRALSAANLFICLTAFALQSLAGLVVSIWPYGEGDAVAVYRTGAVLFLVAEAIALLIFLPLCRRPRPAATPQAG